jgi:uncharacterized membrane protein YphA (DoxX/SURF4 family)
MKQLMGILLIIAALVLLYTGYDKMEKSRVDVKIGNLEISANDKPSNNRAFMYYGLGAISLIGGIAILSKYKV